MESLFGGNVFLKKKCNSYLNNSILGHHIPKLVDATQSSYLSVFRLRHFVASHADLEKEEGGRFGYRVSFLACMLNISGIECLPSLSLSLYVSNISCFPKVLLLLNMVFFVVLGKEPSRWFLVQVDCWWNFDPEICNHCLRSLNQSWLKMCKINK